MVERESPLGTAHVPGPHGNAGSGVGVTLREIPMGSILECAAWPGEEKALMAALARATGLALPDGAGAGCVVGDRAAFGIAPGRFMIVDRAEGLAVSLQQAVGIETGTVTDLSHGRTAIAIEGPKAEWVLAKFFAIDFSLAAFLVGAGRATQHHDIFAQIRRSGEDAFEIYVFRSFARSFWKALCHGAEEVGLKVA